MVSTDIELYSLDIDSFIGSFRPFLEEFDRYPPAFIFELSTFTISSTGNGKRPRPFGRGLSDWDSLTCVVNRNHGLHRIVRVNNPDQPLGNQSVYAPNVARIDRDRTVRHDVGEDRSLLAGQVDFHSD